MRCWGTTASVCAMIHGRLTHKPSAEHMAANFFFLIMMNNFSNSFNYCDSLRSANDDTTAH